MPALKTLCLSSLLAEVARLKAELAKGGSDQAIKPDSPTAAANSAAIATSQAELKDDSLDAAGVMSRLLSVSLDESVSEPRAMRQMIANLERLVEMGPAAVPAIQEYLKKQEDVMFDGASNW